MSAANPLRHSHQHAFSSFQPLEREGLAALSRRNLLKASLAGLAGLSVPRLLETRSAAADAGQQMSSRKSVILLWMTGGPSHIDTWDPKPERPYNNRGPFGVISTKLPGVIFCEHLPKQAAMLDKFTIIRSVDCRKSNHEPDHIMQTGNRDAAPRVNRNGHLYPSIASICAKVRGPNHPGMPPYVAFMKSPSHIAWAGSLGKKYDPFIADTATKLPIYTYEGRDTGQMTGGDRFNLPLGLNQDRIHDRRSLATEFDRIRSEIDQNGSMAAFNSYQQQAVEMVLGRRAQQAFDIEKEPGEVRERYGKHLWCQQTLLARRLVEAGVSFVTLDLSHHPSSGSWDTHGIPGCVYGGISDGLKPFLPTFDHLLTTLVSDLEERGLLDDTLVIAMGEFGRTPNMGTQGSTDGRNHWPVVMSMALAGGGFRHGQVIGSSLADGSDVKERPVTPGDIAATIYHHMQVPLDTTYLDARGRPNFVVIDGKPIGELI
jgi:hypothetical protein